MSVNSDALRIRDMLERTERLIGYLQNVTEAQFLQQPQLQDAVLHNILIIGEAASQVSEPRRNALPQIPWRRIVGMRNQIVHGYIRVNLAVVWATAKNDIPPLLEELLKIVPPESL